jgi:FtsZ-binding cell division protein ZapB
VKQSPREKKLLLSITTMATLTRTWQQFASAHYNQAKKSRPNLTWTDAKREASAMYRKFNDADRTDPAAPPCDEHFEILDATDGSCRRTVGKAKATPPSIVTVHIKDKEAEAHLVQARAEYHAALERLQILGVEKQGWHTHQHLLEGRIKELEHDTRTVHATRERMDELATQLHVLLEHIEKNEGEEEGTKTSARLEKAHAQHLADLRLELRTTMEELAHVESERADVLARLTDATIRIESLSARGIQLDEQLISVKDALEGCRVRERTSLSEQAQRLDEQRTRLLEESQHTAHALTKQVTACQTVRDDLQVQLATLAAQNQLLAQQLEDRHAPPKHKTEHVERKDTSPLLSAEIRALKERNRQLSDDHAKSVHQIHELTQAAERATDRVATTIATTHAKLAEQHQHEMEALRHQHMTLTSQAADAHAKALDTLRIQQHKDKAERDEMQRTLTRQGKELAKQEKELNTLRELKELHKETTRHLAQHHKDASVKDKKLDAMELTIAKHHTEMTVKERAAEILRQQHQEAVAKHHKDVMAQDKELHVLRRQHEDLQHTLAQQHKHASAQEKANTSLLQQHEEMERTLIQQRKDASNQAKEVHALRHQVSELERTMDHQRKNVEEQTASVETWRLKYHKSEASRKVQHQKMSDLEHKLRASEAACTAAQEKEVATHLAHIASQETVDKQRVELDEAYEQQRNDTQMHDILKTSRDRYKEASEDALTQVTQANKQLEYAQRRIRGLELQLRDMPAASTAKASHHSSEYQEEDEDEDEDEQ